MEKVQEKVVTPDLDWNRDVMTPFADLLLKSDSGSDDEKWWWNVIRRDWNDETLLVASFIPFLDLSVKSYDYDGEKLLGETQW